jgi:6-phosphogluconolactonase/glucosamine-6-phosphate isomerase/deaminase
MKNNLNHYLVKGNSLSTDYQAPETLFCHTKPEFDTAVGNDFLTYANNTTSKGELFIVGLSHGISPSGPYEYILKNYDKLQHPELIRYTFVNSKLKKQRGLSDVLDAVSFIKQLLKTSKISKDQILGRSLDRNDLEGYGKGLNKILSDYFISHGRNGLNYVFLASTPKGLVAGISRNSKAFDSDDYVVLVSDNKEPELTFTPHFLSNSERIAFLATKSDKRRPLAWLFYRWGKKDKSPSFLRYIDDVEKRMKVFVDDNALTWPQVEVERETDYGKTSIKVDLSTPYNKNASKKLPVILIIHGFLGLNTFDALLAFLPTHKYLAGAMHYGTVPFHLPKSQYSQFVVDNINEVVGHFGKIGHPVYIFDHSMANNYMLMIDDQMDKMPNFQKYVKGRIGCNPFFGQEAKHASLNFLDNVILKSKISIADRILFKSTRAIIPMQPKTLSRNIGIKLSKWLIMSDTSLHQRIWSAVKSRIMVLIADMDTLPALNRIPIKHTLNRLPIKIFAIQIYSSLHDSKQFDNLVQLKGFQKYKIPTLILKSENDPIARFIPEVYDSTPNVNIMDITNTEETEIFREHLFYMIHPQTTISIINDFISEIEK